MVIVANIVWNIASTNPVIKLILPPTTKKIFSTWSRFCFIEWRNSIGYYKIITLLQHEQNHVQLAWRFQNMTGCNCCHLSVLSTVLFFISYVCRCVNDYLRVGLKTDIAKLLCVLIRTTTCNHEHFLVQTLVI